jgi:hypothetical protein
MRVCHRRCTFGASLFFSRWMFLPRSLTSIPSASSNQPQTQHRHEPHPTATAKESAAAEGPTEDPAILCALAFSDYELWSNPSLRDPNRDGCKLLLHIVQVTMTRKKNSRPSQDGLAHLVPLSRGRLCFIDRSRYRQVSARTCERHV